MWGRASGTPSSSISNVGGVLAIRLALVAYRSSSVVAGERAAAPTGVIITLPISAEPGLLTRLLATAVAIFKHREEGLDGDKRTSSVVVGPSSVEALLEGRVAAPYRDATGTQRII